MKQLLATALLLACSVAHAANPSFGDFNATQFTTNGNKVAVKSGAPITNAYLANTFTANYAEFTNNVQIDGSLVIPTGATNGFVLTTDGSGTASWRTAGGPAGTTNIFDTTIITNNFFVTGKGNTLVVTQAMTLQFLKTNMLATDANGLVTTTKFGAGISWDPATQTISSTASGSGVSTAVTALTYSGTNAAGMDLSTNNMTFKITLTNHVLFGTSTFSNIPNGTSTNFFWTLAIQQDSAGGWVPKFTNSICAWADSNQPVFKTNANAVSFAYFHSHTFTNGMIVGSVNIGVQ